MKKRWERRSIKKKLEYKEENGGNLLTVMIIMIEFYYFEAY
jgi:hypothetical protein